MQLPPKVTWDAVFVRMLFGKMDDDELGAIYEYLTHMPGAESDR